MSIEKIYSEGFTNEQFWAWAKANSISHFIPRGVPVLIVGGTWIRALTLPVRSWPTDPRSEDQTRNGQWGGGRARDDWEDVLHRRSRWRWYALRARPEVFGYAAPADREVTR